MSIEGKIIITTQAKEQANYLSNLFDNTGAVIYSLPAIAIESVPPSENLHTIYNELLSYNWLIFTSKNGIRFFFELFKQSCCYINLHATLKIAVIGQASANELEKFNHTAHFISPGNTSKDFFEHLKKHINKNDSVLLVQGRLASNWLYDELTSITNCTRIDVYNTVKPDHFDSHIINIINKELYDLLVFTSPSAFSNFLEISEIDTKNKEFKIACIGKTTSNAIKKQGFNVSLIAKKSTSEGLKEEIVKYFN